MSVGKYEVRSLETQGRMPILMLSPQELWKQNSSFLLPQSKRSTHVKECTNFNMNHIFKKTQRHLDQCLKKQVGTIA